MPKDTFEETKRDCLQNGNKMAMQKIFEVKNRINPVEVENDSIYHTVLKLRYCTIYHTVLKVQ